MFKKRKKIFFADYIIFTEKWYHWIPMENVHYCFGTILKKKRIFFLLQSIFDNFFALTATATYWKKIRTTITTNVIHKRLCRVIHSRESRGPGKSRLPLLRPKCPLMTLRHYPPKLGRLLQSWPMKELVWVGGWV